MSNNNLIIDEVGMVLKVGCYRHYLITCIWYLVQMLGDSDWLNPAYSERSGILQYESSLN